MPVKAVKFFNAARLDMHIQFIIDGPFKFLDHIFRPHDPRQFEHLLQLAGHVIHHPDIAADLLSYPRANHFDGHRFAGMEFGLVNLGDGG
jgi:hypothetical protein